LFSPPGQRATPGSDLDPSQGFSRFTERARNVVMAAQNEASAAHNDQIRPEHLVLGLLSETEALGARAIIAQGVSLATVRKTVTATLPSAAEQVPALIPYDPQAKKALELTFRQALRMGHNYIGTEHLLLALLELEAGSGALNGLGVDKATAEANITRAVAAASAAHDQASGPSPLWRCSRGRQRGVRMQSSGRGRCPTPSASARWRTLTCCWDGRLRRC
jgi:ATP-dependent Clp protease ATP-binding subunit ClpA